MISVTIELQKLEIEKFSLRDGVELKIFFNDGGNKALMFSTDLENPEADAQKALLKLRTYEKEINSNSDDDNFLDSFVNVKIKDEEKKQARIVGFISKLREEKKKLTRYSGHSGYLDSLNQVKSNKIDL